MKNKLYTVTLAISAYNEESNIGSFLKSVLIQKEKGFVLKDIQIYSDGSTDKTISIIKSFKNDKIKVFDSKKRKGKSSRLNQIYRSLTSDFLVQSDADVVFTHPYVIYDVIQPLIRNKNVVLTGGQRIVVTPMTLIERVHAQGFSIWNATKGQIHGGDNIHNHHGTLSAMNKHLSDKVRMPSDLYGTDDYVYLLCKSLEFSFKYVANATVYFKGPETLSDYIRQHRRFLAGKHKMATLFGNKVYSEYKIPVGVKLRALLKGFSKRPILTSFYIFFESAMRLYSRLRKYSQSNYWDTAVSTKKVLNS